MCKYVRSICTYVRAYVRTYVCIRMAFRSCCIVESTRLKWFTILRLSWQCRKTSLYTLAGQSSDAFRRWTDKGFFSQMLGLHYHPWDNSSGACAHKLWFGQLKINATDTRCLLSHNEEWYAASRLESWGCMHIVVLSVERFASGGQPMSAPSRSHRHIH